MVAKIMCFSLVWYHAGIMPGWELALQCIKKRVQSFIWKRSILKVAKSTLRLLKNEGRLQVWSLVDKAKAFTTMWVIKLIQNKTNPILESTVQASVNWYSNTTVEITTRPLPQYNSHYKHKTPGSMGKCSSPQPCNPRRGLDCLL
jgi:hypothetical protein